MKSDAGDVLHVMTYDDFAALYVTFKEGKNEEILQVVFELLKLSPEHFWNKSPDD